MRNKPLILISAGATRPVAYLHLKQIRAVDIRMKICRTWELSPANVHVGGSGQEGSWCENICGPTQGSSLSLATGRERDGRWLPGWINTLGPQETATRRAKAFFSALDTVHDGGDKFHLRRTGASNRAEAHLPPNRSVTSPRASVEWRIGGCGGGRQETFGNMWFAS